MKIDKTVRKEILIRRWTGDPAEKALGKPLVPINDFLFEWKVAEYPETSIRFIDDLWGDLCREIDTALNWYGSCCELTIIVCEPGSDRKVWVPIS